MKTPANQKHSRKTEDAIKRRLQRVVGLRPCDCDSITDLCSMDTTHKSVGKYDILLQHDQAVILTEHPSGEQCRASITIPKRVFRKMLDWYETEQPNAKVSDHAGRDAVRH